MTVVSIAYAEDGRIASVSFKQGDAEKKFTYSYLKGSNLLEKLEIPASTKGMLLTQTWEEKRDLLTEMLYTRVNNQGQTIEVTRRGYKYDKLGRPVSREQAYPQQKEERKDAFDYNDRSELIKAMLGAQPYAYTYDNIGNRTTAREDTEHITYDANELNQYSQIDTNGKEFIPEYDENGNQTLIKTATGIWRVKYNGQNRAIRYESEDGTIVITCVYDSQGRRTEKKVEQNGDITSHIRFVYRGYLQVAAYDLLKEGYPSLHQIIWDPTQPIATRPLAIRMGDTFYAYGWDLTKNICETYAGGTGYLASRYTYTPYGQVTASGDISQSIQWSSEVYDGELGLVYYNYRYYNPLDGRWTRRDPLDERSDMNLYNTVANKLTQTFDYLGSVPTSSLQTPAGQRILLALATMTATGVVGGITANMLHDRCDMPNTFSNDITFEIACTRKCKSKKKDGKCKNPKGKGKRKGRFICRSGIILNTWEFAEWVEMKGHDCNAPKCSSCCTSTGFTYSSKV